MQINLHFVIFTFKIKAMNKKIFFLLSFLLISLSKLIAQKSYFDYAYNDKEFVFWEEFYDNSKGWWSGDNNTIAEIRNGYYYLERTKSSGASFTYYPVTWNEKRDYEIEVMLRMEGGHPEAYVNGLLWGLDKKDSKYNIFGINQNKKFVIAAFMPEWENFKSWTDENSIRYDKYNKLTFRSVNGIWYFFINENYVASFFGKTIWGHYIGFHIGPSSKLIIDSIGLAYLKKKSKSVSGDAAKSKEGKN